MGDKSSGYSADNLKGYKLPVLLLMCKICFKKLNLVSVSLLGLGHFFFHNQFLLVWVTGRAGACPSCHRMRGRVQPGQK